MSPSLVVNDVPLAKVDHAESDQSLTALIEEANDAPLGSAEILESFSDWEKRTHLMSVWAQHGWSQAC